MSSLVTMSVNCLTPAMSSGRFENRAKRCLTWKPVPSGLSSTVGTTWPNAPAHAANDAVPCVSSVLGAR